MSLTTQIENANAQIADPKYVQEMCQRGQAVHEFLLQSSTPLRNLAIVESREPQASAQAFTVRFQTVSRARFQESQQALSDDCACLVALEVDQTFLATRADAGGARGTRQSVDAARFLGVVHQVVGVQADERNAALREAGGLHLRAQGDKVAHRLAEAFQAGEVGLFAGGDKVPGSFQTCDVGREQSESDLVGRSVILDP